VQSKTLEYYLSLRYPFQIETLSDDDGGGFLISYPDLEGCISDGDTIEEAIEMGNDAKQSWISARLEEGFVIPEPEANNLRYSGRITLRTPKTLHRKLVHTAQAEGVSLNQYLLYLVSKNSV